MKASAPEMTLVPPGLVTVTSTAPAPDCDDGEVALIEVSEVIVKLAPLSVPKSTAVALEKPLPVITTGVPPGAGPLETLRPVTVGTAK